MCGADGVTPSGAVEVLPTLDALMHRAANEVAAAAGRAIAATGRCALALAGGSTPRGLYRLLASAAYAARMDWPRVHVFWGDERCVPPDAAQSNYRLAAEALLARVPIAADHVHRMRGEDDPAAAAGAYERDLRAFFATPEGPPRLVPGARFDLILLGLGEDGHTASLFPGATALWETVHWVTGGSVAAVSGSRITLTPPVINAAAEIVFLVSGRAKADALQRVLEGPPRPQALPAQAIVPRAGRLRWLVDADAASRLTPRGTSRHPGIPLDDDGKSHRLRVVLGPDSAGHPPRGSR